MSFPAPDPSGRTVPDDVVVSPPGGVRDVPPVLGDHRYTDTEKRKHNLLSILAEGGQGAVYTTKTAEVAVKLLKTSSTTGDLTRVIRSVSQLPIRDLPIAMPYSAIIERPGYVMTMVRGMEPIAALRKHSPRSLVQSLGWYQQTGGLRRRVAIMAKVGDLLASLHGRGVVYGDLNPNNVMASTGLGEQIWLIDTDNMRYADDLGGSPYFLGYAAPEHFDYPHLVAFESDAFSFAVLAFETITGLRPFLDGREVGQTRPDGQAEIDAHRGLLPSVLEKDGTNQSDYWLLDRALLLSPNLLDLFERSFGPGRQDPSARPTPSQFARALWEAHDSMNECSACGFTWQGTVTACPSCAAPLTPNAALAIGVRDSGAESVIWRVLVGSRGVTIRRRALLLDGLADRLGRGSDAAVIRCSRAAEGIELEGEDGVTLTSPMLRRGEIAHMEIDGRHGMDLWLESA